MRRQEILDAALECLARSGFRGTDLATVARAAGTTASHILYYFESKDDLVWELVEAGNLELKILAENMYKLDATEGFAHLPEAGRLMEHDPTPARLMVVMMAENLETGPLHDHFVERRRQLRARTTEMIRRSQRKGLVRRDVDAKAEAADLCAFLDGVVANHLLDPSATSIEAGLRRYVDRLMDAIATAPSAVRDAPTSRRRADGRVA